MWSLTVLGLLEAATIFNVLGMVGLSLIVIYSGAYNKFKTIQTPVGRGGNDGKGKKNKCLGIIQRDGIATSPSDYSQRIRHCWFVV